MVKWPPSCLGDWHAGHPSLALVTGKPGSDTHASASLPGFVILPLVSLPACVSRPRAGPRAGVLYQTQWHKYTQLGWQGTQRALPDGPLPRLVLAVLVQGSEGLFMQLCVPLGQGKSWVSAFHPQAGSPIDPPPDTPLSAVYLTPLHRVNGKTLGDCTRLYTVIPHRSWFWYLRIPLLPRRVSSKSAPTAPWWPLTGVQGATHSNHPTHIPSGAGQGDACLLWALGQHMCPFHCLLAGTNLRIFPGSQKSLLADSRPHRT